MATYFSPKNPCCICTRGQDAIRNGIDINKSGNQLEKTIISASIPAFDGVTDISPRFQQNYTLTFDGPGGLVNGFSTFKYSRDPDNANFDFADTITVGDVSANEAHAALLEDFPYTQTKATFWMAGPLLNRFDDNFIGNEIYRPVKFRLEVDGGDIYEWNTIDDPVTLERSQELDNDNVLSYYWLSTVLNASGTNCAAPSVGLTTLSKAKFGGYGSSNLNVSGFTFNDCFSQCNQINGSYEVDPVAINSGAIHPWSDGLVTFTRWEGVEFKEEDAYVIAKVEQRSNFSGPAVYASVQLAEPGFCNTSGSLLSGLNAEGTENFFISSVFDSVDVDIQLGATGSGGGGLGLGISQSCRSALNEPGKASFSFG